MREILIPLFIAVYFWCAGDAYRSLRDANVRQEKRLRAKYPTYKGTHPFITFLMCFFWLPGAIVALIIGVFFVIQEKASKK